MKTHTFKLRLIILLALLIITSACRKKAPDGFSADFSVTYDNGGMAPENVMITAEFPDADSYQWSVEGVPSSGQQTSASFQTAGSYEVELLVESGKHDRSNAIVVPIGNFPAGGTALTVVQENGVIGTTGLDGEDPFFVPIDTLDDGALTGMDYDDKTKQLYYTGSIYRAFPNGVGKEKIFDDSELSPGDKIVDLVVDSEDKRVYFGINGFQTQSIASVNDDGSDLNFELQFITSIPPIQHITLDAANNEVYFTTDFSTSISKTIQGDLSTVYFDDNQKHALVFDNSTRYLYYAEQVFDNSGATQNNILRFKPDDYSSNLPDTWPEIIVSAASTDTIRGMDISERKQQLYWSDSEERVIYRIDLNNLQAKKEIVFENVVNPRALAVGNFD